VYAASKSNGSGILGQQVSQPGDKQILYGLVSQARDQWEMAREYFEFVKDPDLVDLAINNLEVAEKRYNYLLKQLRQD
jgi:hypothetical protein